MVIKEKSHPFNSFYKIIIFLKSDKMGKKRERVSSFIIKAKLTMFAIFKHFKK